MILTLILILLLISCLQALVVAKRKVRPDRPDLADLPPDILSPDEYFNLALDTDDENYRQKADYFWHAVLLGPGDHFTVKDAYDSFLQVFYKRGIPEQAYIYIANEYLSRGDMENGIKNCKTAISLNSKSIEAYQLISRALPADGSDVSEKISYLNKALEIDPKNSETHSLLGSTYFTGKNWDKSLYHLEKAVSLDPLLTKAHANAVYLRNNMCKWGKNGTQYFKDMEAIERIVRAEINTSMKSPRFNEWQSVVFPHTALAYRVDPMVKYAAAASYARFEKAQIINRGSKETDHSLLLPRYLEESVEFIRNVSVGSPVCSRVTDVEVEASTGDARSVETSSTSCRSYNHSDGAAVEFAVKSNFRIKVAYVSAGLTTKALTYLVQDMFAFHNRDKFEVHVYATSKPDPPFFINTIMRGVDYREKIKDGAEHFHDVSGKSCAEVIKMMKKVGIHILINWDGYAQNGAKLEGLFGLHPAPIQISHMVRTNIISN